jgi:hypothetical protein
MDGFSNLLSFLSEIPAWLTGSDQYAVISFVIAGVFLWSGISKLRQPALTSMAMVDFGLLRVPRPLAGVVAGAFELTVAGGLCLALAFPALQTYAVLLAVGTLWVFVFLLARALHGGRHFACRCFGDTESEISAATLIRTLALAAGATVLLPGIPGTSAPANDVVLQAVVAVGVLGTVSLASTMRLLLRWNQDPLMLAPANWVEGR